MMFSLGTGARLPSEAYAAAKAGDSKAISGMAEGHALTQGRA
jgi:hypothetical protein